jgi:hypothetical protein
MRRSNNRDCAIENSTIDDSRGEPSGGCARHVTPAQLVEKAQAALLAG